MPQPYKLFTIYAREDAQYLEELRGQLRPLEHAGRIKVWSDREINPGVDWEREIVQNLDSADIILILVSAAYYNSAYIHEKEITHAINRHERGEAKVLPVIVRPCSFLDDPVISRLQVLPTDGKPVNSHHWRERDDAWLDVVAGVKRTIEVMQQAEWQREADAKKGKEEEKRAREEAKERAENEHLVQIRRKQEQEARDADLKAWQQAADAHILPAYENYLARYPQGEYAREARFRIKELKKKNANPLSWERYAIAGGGVLAVMLLVWLVSNMFGGNSDGMTQSHPVTKADSTRGSEISSIKDLDPSTNQTTEGSKTLPVNSLPENITVAKPTAEKAKKEEAKQSQPDSRSRKSGFEMVHVQGGTFTMGSPTSEADRFGNECQHSVTVSSFSIGKYEVTQADWWGVMGSAPSYFKNCDECPVEGVSWSDIQDFLEKLNVKYPGKNYRLPTEVEWEYAARGGNASSNNYFLYSGTNKLDIVAWYHGNSDGKTHPIGIKKSNQLGLHDMSGNVAEVCQDSYKPYPCDIKTVASWNRIVRGGSWAASAIFCRSSNRSDLGPFERSFGIGFRLATSSN